ncbi:MAG: DUF1697 domain-containing protein [Comamonas sp.]|jgi:uncharacterized protein (DUF1697 family)|uniref:DUF1697 domain-containing protein n=1 Tax=Comamonas sp. TaxID=34028 RepID=UPI00281D34B3|nr:DUF1697 domain-containing protein [Comamonas sp.]MDR0216893.1 DUF1697 domain-containing protein [Comamonas sp.]MDR2299313.1 DUF1697 domain-containing protein [Comamonas sp.]
MPVYIALLRAVNVGGTGKLPMAELKAMCEAAGFEQVRTYIASGNVVFKASGTAPQVKAALMQRLASHAGKPVEVFVRTAQEMADVLAANPFPDSPGHQSVAIFLDATPPADTLEHIKGQNDEQVQLGLREIYVAYGSGMGQSKLKIPAAAQGTARNINTVAKLAQMAAEM